MLWLYYRRLRVPALVISLSLAALFGLTIGVGSMIGTDRRPPGVIESITAGISGAQLHAAPGPVGSATVRRGLRLMAAAETACQNVTYRGEQMVVWWGPSGANASLVQVWHRLGQQELTLGTNDVDLPASARPTGSAGSTVSSHVTAGVLSVSAWMLSLMRDNYLIEYAGTGTASGRPASLVVIRRQDGSVAARYWLDRATGLPLRREIFDSSGHLVNEGVFIDLHVGDAEVPDVPAPRAPAWRSQPTRAGLAALRKQHWPVPARLPGNLSLVTLTHTATKSGDVVDASYSDGLSVVSIFLQRGRLPSSMPDWKRATVDGARVYLSVPGARSVAWSADGFVYTVIADASSATVGQIVAGLPHDRHEGFWQRTGRGLKRIISWLDPFH
ncbi:MAG: sigma-E factor regulatory protein RseB domain-containing protein [Streptosporangiaceae bacterium]